MGRAALRTTAAVASAVLGVCVALPSCTSDPDDDADGQGTEPTSVVSGSIDSASIESQVAETLTDLGMAPESVACPEDLAAEVGEESRCEVNLDGSTFGVTVEVASTEGGEAVLDVVVDDQPA